MRLRVSPNEIPARLDQLQEGLRKLEERTSAFRRELKAHGRDLARIGPQVAALEQRVDSLRQRAEPSPVADEGEQQQARSLLELVRREHEQVRARVAAAARAEERLSRLEDEVAALRTTRRQDPPKN